MSVQDILDSPHNPSIKTPIEALLGVRCLGIDHIAIAVPDIEESIRWYCDNLGFELIERRLTEGAATAMISAVVKSGSAVVVLVQGLSPECQVSRFIDHFGPGVQHLAFGVEDLDAALEQIKVSGAAPDIDVIEGEGIRQVFLRRDPGSGVRIELIERRGGTFGDATVKALYRAFEAQSLF